MECLDDVLNDMKVVLHSYKNELRMLQNQRYFKTGPADYGAGDVFIGVSMPHIRLVAKRFSYVSLDVLSLLLVSSIHEERSLALVILVNRYQKEKGVEMRKVIFDFYVAHMDCVNNWDLVDVSAPQVVGGYLYECAEGNERKNWALSANMWYRRIAVVSTLYDIRRGCFEVFFDLIAVLYGDREDLIHKALGWMLREIGKGDKEVLYAFLEKNWNRVARTTLRYAIERFTVGERDYFLRKR